MRKTKIIVFFTMIMLLMITITPLVNAESSDNSAIGDSSTLVQGSGNAVTGTGAEASYGNQNTAVGVSVQVVNGSNNQVLDFGALSTLGNGNTAIGYDAQVISGNNNKVIGFGAQAGGGSYNTAIGQHTSAINGDGNTALGSESYAGGSQGASGLNTAVGYGAQASAGASVALGAYSVAYEPGTVSVGNQDYQRRITNLAPGIYDTDAVNMSQLRSVDNKVNRVGSIAMAMSGLAPLAYDPKDPTQYSAAYGTYNGVGAIALGVYHYTKPTVMYNMAIAMSDDKWEKAARFGVTWRTGGPKPKVLTPTVAAKTQDEETIESGVKIILPERMPKK